MGGTMIKQIPKNVTLTVLEKPTTKGGYTWYYVNADGNKGYLRSDVVKYSSGGTASTTTSAGTTTTNSNIDSNATGYVMTTSPDVISGSKPVIHL